MNRIDFVRGKIHPYCKFRLTQKTIDKLNAVEKIKWVEYEYGDEGYLPRISQMTIEEYRRKEKEYLDGPDDLA